MSEKQEPIFMEQDEYMEYLKNQIKTNPEVAATPIAQMNLYQMNKDLVRGITKMNNMAINEALEKVAKEWFDPNVTHYALLNHEHHYFTIFQKDSGKTFIKELKNILVNYYGDHDIRAIDIIGNAVEIWAMWDGEPTVAYLFPYSEGVVYY